MKRSPAILRRIREFNRSQRPLGESNGEAKPRTAACKFDISIAAGNPFPATSAMHRSLSVSSGEGEDVEIVAADVVCWLPGSGDFKAGNLRNVLRQESLLNRPRFFDFLLLDVETAMRFSSEPDSAESLAGEILRRWRPNSICFFSVTSRRVLTHGFFDEIAHPVLHRFHRKTDARLTRHYDDRRGRLDSRQMREQIEAFSPRRRIARIVQIH